METTVGHILLKNLLPKDLQHYASKTLDKKNIEALFKDITVHHPEQFNHLASEIARFGFETSTRQGSSVSLEDLKSPIDKNKRFDELEAEIAKIRKKGLSKEKENEEILEKYFEFTSTMDKDIIEEGLKKDNTLAKIIKAGARGSVAQYRSTVASPGLVLDSKENPLVNFPVKHSFSEGLSLPEYLITSYGARSGELSKKVGTAKGGYYAKQTSRSSLTIQVVEHDCGTANGVPFPVSDRDSIGSFLAHPIQGYKKNNEITAEVLADLQNKKVFQIVVRSPLTCQSSKQFHNGAVCQLCTGIRENGLPEIGSYVGVIAAGSISEPLSQSLLNRKHTSGTASGTSTSVGFDLINQLANIPKNFPEGATIASHAGKITSIKKADAGGHYINVDKTEHYVQPGFNMHVNLGDEVEAGDVLSEGVIDPSEIVKHKGIGAGRKHYVEAMHKAFKESGIGVNRRNFELVAKNAIDHVKIIDPSGLGDYLPDQIVSYQGLEKSYHPRENSKLMRIDVAKGHYLEEPVLHFTIGTLITKSVIEELKRNGVESINVNEHKPGFEPVMQRLLDVPEYEPDLFHQLYSTYLNKRLSTAVNTGVGASSDLKGPSPILGLAYSKGFGSGQY